MRSRGIRARKFCYTGMFNACANHPKNHAKFEKQLYFIPSKPKPVVEENLDPLVYARNLRDIIKRKSDPLHQITYHAMIKGKVPLCLRACLVLARAK